MPTSNLASLSDNSGVQITFSIHHILSASPPPVGAPNLLRLQNIKLLGLALLCFALPGLGCGSNPGGLHGRMRIYALKYGEGKYSARLVNTLKQENLVNLNWLVYLVVNENPRQYTLIDTGFDDATLRRKFGLQKTKTIAELLSLVGVRSIDIDQVFLTHTHFDHAHNLPQFTNSTVYLQSREYAALADKSIAAFLSAAKLAGRLRLIEHSRMTHGIFATIFTGGHTPGSQAIFLNANGRNFIFTGDECYFQDACRVRMPLPVAAANSPENNRAFLRTLDSGTEILTGHETHLTGGHWLNEYVYVMQ